MGEIDADRPDGIRGGGYRELLTANRDFRLLWLAQVSSLFGDWFNLIASTALLSLLTGAGAAGGGLFAIRMLAPFLASPVAGILADRFDRRRILIATDVLRVFVALAFLTVRTPSQACLIFVLTALQMGISGIFFPVRMAILPDISTRRLLGAANALSSATWSTMLAIGAAAGGIFTGLLGIRPAFVLDSATFAVSALLLTRMASRPHTRRHVSTGQDGVLGTALRGAAREYIDGLRYLWSRKPVMVLALQKAAILFNFITGFQVAAVAIAGRVFGGGAGGGSGALGLLFAAGGFGSAVGPLFGRCWTADRPRALRRAIATGYVLMAGGLAIAAPLHSLVMTVIGAALRGVGGGLIWVFSTQLLLEAVPDRLRGRVVATEHAALTLLGAAGSATVGAGLKYGVGPSAVLWLLIAALVAPFMDWAARGVLTATSREQ